jgi:MFS family permease
VLGVMLDRYGPRRVQAVLLAMAALGSALFGLSFSRGELIVARVLIGLGFAGGLMAAIKAITLWYPPQRWGLITGFHMMAGGLGSMAATLPIEWSLSVMSWQGLFFWLAGLCLVTAAILFVVVPERAQPRQGHVGRAVPHHRHGADRQLLLAHPALLSSSSSPSSAASPCGSDRGCATSAASPTRRRAPTSSSTPRRSRPGLRHERRDRRRLPPDRRQQLRLGRHHERPVRAGVRLARLLPSFHPVVAWPLFGFLGACPIQYMPLLVSSFPAHYAGRVSTSSNLVVFTVIFAGQWAIRKIVDL